MLKQIMLFTHQYTPGPHYDRLAIAARRILALHLDRAETTYDPAELSKAMKCLSDALLPSMIVDGYKNKDGPTSPSALTRSAVTSQGPAKVKLNR